MTNDTEKTTDHEAFLRLFSRFEGNLRAFVASLIPTWDGVDEVMQESSVVLWRKFDQFDSQGEESSFLEWAFMIARYEVLKYRRRRATDRFRLSDDVFDLLADEAASVAEQQREREQALQQCVQNLATRQRELVKAVYEDGVAIKDVAAQAGRTPTGLYKALARVRDRLAACVRAKLGGIKDMGGAL
jgi:RNA polymerase sigma-70 factor, ECF subfamily